MSLILDALRKMELERKAKRQKSQEVRAEVLNYRGTTPAYDKSRTVPVMAALLLVSATAAAFFYFTKPAPQPVVSPPQREPLQQNAAPAIAPLPLPPPPAEPQVQNERRREEQKAAEPARTSAGSPPVNQHNGAAGLTVSGIAWQDERSLRRAVINGFLVGEGGEVQGAKIVEIKENRVIFSRNGESFEVTHSSGAGK